MKAILYSVIVGLLILNIKKGYSQNDEGRYYTHKGMPVKCLIESNEFVWVGTNYGLIRIKIGTEEKVLFDIKNSPLPNDSINALFFDGSGDLWIGTSGGLVKYLNDKWTVYSKSNSPLPSNNINSIISTNYFDGVKWIGTSMGLAKFDEKNWTIYTRANSDIPNDFINKLALDIEGSVWMISGEYNKYNYLTKYDSKNWITYNIPDTFLTDHKLSPTAFVIDDKGNKWIGTYYNGIIKFDNTNWTNYPNDNNPYNLTTNVISLCIVPWEGIWVGLGDQNRITHVPFNASWTYGYELPFGEFEVATSILTSRSYKFLWIGTEMGLLTFDREKRTIKATEIINGGLNSNIINDLIIDSNNIIWMSTPKGLTKLDNDKWAYYGIEVDYNEYQPFRKIALDDKGNIWIGSNKGLMKFDNDSIAVLNIENSGLPENNIIDLLTDDFGNIWMATYNGKLVKYDGSSWDSFNIRNLYSCDIRNLNIDKNNNIWISTNCKSVIKYDGNAFIQYDKTNSGLPDDNINDITVDNYGNIWFATNSSGIVKYDEVSWTLFNTSNSSLPSNKTKRIFVDDYRQMWIGTDKGLTKYNNNSWTTYPNYPNNPIDMDKNGSLWVGTSWSGLYEFSFDKSGLMKYINEISLSNTLISKDSPIGTVVGILKSNVNGLISFKLVEGKGDDDNQRFMISDNILKIAKNAEYAQKPYYIIRIQAVDIYQNTFVRNFKIVVTDSEITSILDSKTVEIIQIYPNPASNFIYIQGYGNQQQIQAELFDFTGKKVMQKNIVLNSKLSVKEYPTGLYLFRISKNSTTFHTEKIFIE